MAELAYIEENEEFIMVHEKRRNNGIKVIHKYPKNSEIDLQRMFKGLILSHYARNIDKTVA